MMRYDLLIAGGGIAGMTAAIYAARGNLKTCIIEGAVCGGLVNSTNIVENMPSYDSIHGIELMARCRSQVEKLGVEIREVETVVSASLCGDMKQIVTDGDETCEAPAIIIATGRKPRPLPVETQFPNVHYCAICDGSAYKGCDVIVLGGGNSAFDESLYLLGLDVAHIHIVEALDDCAAAASAKDRLLATGKASISVATEIVGVECLENGNALVRLHDRKTNRHIDEVAAAIFCFIGQEPNAAVFAKELDMERGYIKTDADMKTNLPGVFAAGDVRVKKYRQITTAMADGTIAALGAMEYLRGRNAQA